MLFCITDIETTGGSPKSSKITEIAIYKHDGIRIVDEFVTLINPELPIPEFISRLTGINDRMVEGAPKFYEIAKQIVEFTEDAIFVAHNVAFDYGMIRHEFKRLGFDFRRPHLCTVRSSRYVLPGKESYSLGKLTRSLGIEINGRHRAGGDALATAELFKILMETDPKGLQTFIQQELNPKVLHPNLDLDKLDEIPNKTGIYRFYNDQNQLIYIGKSKHIRTRIEQHLRNTKTQKGIKMLNDIARIEYELTGSELIALLEESALIKRFQPFYNRALKRNTFPYGIYDYMDEAGYIRLLIDYQAKRSAVPLITFTTKKDAQSYLEHVCEQYELCQKLCSLYPTQGACFHHTIKKCHGACINEESTESYNERCQEFVDRISLGNDSFFIIEKGRQKGEKSLIWIENGMYRGFGYAPYHFYGNVTKKWTSFITLQEEDRDAKSIIIQHLRKFPELDKVYL